MAFEDFPLDSVSSDLTFLPSLELMILNDIQEQILGWTKENRLLIFDAYTLKEIENQENTTVLTDILKIYHGSAMVFIQTAPKTVLPLDLHENKFKDPLHHELPISSVYYDSTDEKIILGDEEGFLAKYCAKTYEKESQHKLHEDELIQVYREKEGTFLTLGLDGMLYRWSADLFGISAEDLQCEAEVSFDFEIPTTFAVDEQTLYVGLTSGRLYSIERTSLEIQYEFDFKLTAITGILPYRRDLLVLIDKKGQILFVNPETGGVKAGYKFPKKITSHFLFKSMLFLFHKTVGIVSLNVKTLKSTE